MTKKPPAIHLHNPVTGARWVTHSQETAQRFLDAGWKLASLTGPLRTAGPVEMTPLPAPDLPDWVQGPLENEEPT